ncbi:MAG: LPS export ABC transporter periplasmic protein LptC [Gemmatimonadetes bacterium]|nr:LPS export ABC transporter periplasmic protein LptC [Gemmatimonadota bacterium]
MRRFALGLVVVSGAACGDERNSPVASAELVSLPADQVVYGLSHYMTTQGVRQAHVRADTAYFYEDSATVQMRGVTMTVYGELGQDRAVVTSAEGWLDSRTELMRARGRVVVVSQDQDKRIETEELFYDPRGDRIWSTVATLLREGGRTLRGSGFESDGQLQNIRVTDARSEGVLRF